jgi:hypothetical protein
LKHSQPLDVRAGEVYYDIDTFDEDEFMRQKTQGDLDGEEAEDTAMADPENDQSMDVDAPSEDVPVAKSPAKSKKTKEKKSKSMETKEQAEDNEGEGQEGESSVEDEEDGQSKKSSKKERQRLKLEEFKARRAAAKAAKAELKAQEEPKKAYDPMDGVDPSFDISAWKDYAFSSMIENALKKLKFTKPSPIQEKALPLGLAGRDVVGVAETVSHCPRLYSPDRLTNASITVEY